MKTMRLGLAAAGWVLAAAAAWGAVGVGSTREEVVDVLGRPTGTGKRGASEFLYYGGSVVEIRNGKVVQFPAEMAQYADKREQGLVQVNGKWVTPADKQKIDQDKVKLAAIGPKVKIISNGGKKVELKDLVVPGKITIVDFYADWCGPCREMAPQLEAMAKEDEDVFLRKVNIVSWDTEVAQQYDLHAIPNVRVFDRKGGMVGKPTYDPNDVASYLLKAK